MKKLIRKHQVGNGIVVTPFGTGRDNTVYDNREMIPKGHNQTDQERHQEQGNRGGRYVRKATDKFAENTIELAKLLNYAIPNPAQGLILVTEGAGELKNAADDGTFDEIKQLSSEGRNIEASILSLAPMFNLAMINAGLKIPIPKPATAVKLGTELGEKAKRFIKDIPWYLKPAYKELPKESVEKTTITLSPTSITTDKGLIHMAPRLEVKRKGGIVNKTTLSRQEGGEIIPMNDFAMKAMLRRKAVQEELKKKGAKAALTKEKEFEKTDLEDAASLVFPTVALPTFFAAGTMNTIPSFLESAVFTQSPNINSSYGIWLPNSSFHKMRQHFDNYTKKP